VTPGLILHALNLCSEQFSSMAWIAGEGDVLFARGLDGIEAGLLPLAAQTVAQYFPLGPNDAVLVKDPAAGGPGQDRLALITCVRPASTTTPHLWLATGFAAPSTRGMKCPPVPIMMNGELNAAFVAALGPAKEQLTKEIEKHRAVRLRWASPPLTQLWDRKHLAELQARTRENLKAKVAEWPEGESHFELSTGQEQIRLHLHSDGHSLRFDFSGTSAGRRLFLPLAATSGVVRTTVREWLELPLALDWACEAFFTLSTPNGCFLNARSQDSCDACLPEAAAWLRTAVEGALHRWDRRQNRGVGNYFDLNARIEFANQTSLELRLPSGSPARESTEGASFLRARTDGCEISLEAIEKSFPVHVQRVSERNAPSGKGRVSGGRGLSFQLQVKEPATLAWHANGSVVRTKTEKHQTAFDSCEVRLKRSEVDESLNPSEPIQLEAGDVLTFLSGSGGGLL
jgi:hypothetical protein